MYILSPWLDTTARQIWARRKWLDLQKWGTFIPVLTNIACIGIFNPPSKNYGESCDNILYRHSIFSDRSYYLILQCHLLWSTLETVSSLPTKAHGIGSGREHTVLPHSNTTTVYRHLLPRVMSYWLVLPGARHRRQRCVHRAGNNYDNCHGYNCIVPLYFES